MANGVVGFLRTILAMDSTQFESGARKSVAAAVQLDRSLGKLGDQTDQLTPRAERMVKAFSGQRLVAQANDLTGAVNKLGGAQRLTRQEQERVNRTLTDAIAKYKVLGQTAPAEMLKLQAATAATARDTLTLDGLIGKLGPTLAATFSIGAITGFARSVGDFAGRMTDLAAETGIGVERLQALNFEAVGVGLTIEDVTNSVGQLARRLAGGDQSAARALEKLNLQVNDLRRQRPDEILIAILQAAAAIEDPLERQRLFFELFGRTGSRMLRLVRDDFGDVITEVEKSGAVIRKELIEQADQFDDAWQQALIRVKASVVSTAALIGSAFSNIQPPSGFEAAKVGGAGTPPAVEAARQAAQIQADIDKQLKDMLAKVRRPGQELPPQFVATDKGFTAPSPSEEDIKRWQKLSEALVQSITDAEAYREAVKRLVDDIGGAGAAQSVKQLEDAFLKLSPAQQANASVVADVLTRYATLRQRVGPDLAPVLETLFQQTGTLTNNFNKLAASFTRWIQVGHDANDVKKDMLQLFTAAPPAIEAEVASINGRLIPAVFGLKAAYDASARAKAEHDELLAAGMIAPPITIGPEDATGEAREIAREALNEQLEEQRQQIVDFWRRQVGVLEEASIGRLGTLFFGNLGRDVNEQLRAAADEAHQDFLRIQRSGRATAEELTLAMRRWREAEERANGTFGQRWEEFWGGLQQSFVTVLDDMLQHFLKSFLGGMIRGIGGARLGERLASAFLGGGGGGGGGGIPGVPGLDVTRLIPGLGGGGTAMAAGFGVPGLGAAGAPGGAFYGAAAPGAGAGAGAGGGAGFLTNPAFWTNPWTIAGIGAAALLTWGITKKGWLRGGEEALKVNPRRDKFIGQFGPPGTGPGSGFGRLAAKLTEITGESGGGRMFAALTRADSEKRFENAQAAIVAALAGGGMRNVKSYQFGGFTPPNTTELALLHGGQFGELHIPLKQPMNPNQQAQRMVNLTVHVRAWDGQDVRRVFRGELIPLFKQALNLNTDELASTTRRVVTP